MPKLVIWDDLNVDGESREIGQLIVIDGPSSAGKSTIAAKLIEDTSLDLDFVKRYTTRGPRPGDCEENNYVFVSESEFSKMEESSEFLEVRHFDFGMSYGLSWRDIDQLISSGRNPLAIISLGNLPLVKRRYPSAIGIFVTASIETIERRLRARGIGEEKILERLANARHSIRYYDMYDYVARNENGRLDEQISSLIAFLKEHLSNGNRTPTSPES